MQSHLKLVLDTASELSKDKTITQEEDSTPNNSKEYDVKRK